MTDQKSYQDRYQEWLQQLADTDPLKEELTRLCEDEEEIRDRFYQELAFGTAGLRGKLGAGTTGYVYFVDFDRTRERTRKCRITVIGE